MGGTNSKIRKHEKTWSKNYFLRAARGEMRLKSLDPQKAHLGPILNVHTKFQLPSSIWRVDIKGTALFQSQKEGKSSYLSPPHLIDLGGGFFDMLYNFRFSINWLKKGQILRSWPFRTSSPLSHPQKETWLNFDSILSPLINI